MSPKFNYCSRDLEIVEIQENIFPPNGPLVLDHSQFHISVIILVLDTIIVKEISN